MTIPCLACRSAFRHAGNTSALILMLSTITLVSGMTIYFFVKVLTTPPNPEPDSYLENDDVEERKEPEGIEKQK